MATNIHLVEEAANASQPTTPAPRPAPAFPHFPWTDAGNAELIAKLFADRLRFDNSRGKWMCWNGTIWVDDTDGQAMRWALKAARTRLHNVRDLEDAGADQIREYAWARASEHTSRIKSALEQVKAMKPISDSGLGWNADAYLFAAANGVIELRNGRLRPGRADDRITMQSTVPYDPTAKCPRWERFLDEIFASNRELISYVQRAFGYSLTADAKEQCFFSAHGSGANGKSTLFNILGELLGQYGTTLPFSVLEAPGKNSGSRMTDLAGLIGCRFVSVVEVNEAQPLDPGRIKSLTGEDVMKARFLYCEAYPFKPVAKFWLAFNHKPIIRDDTHGLWRRVHLIPFSVCFDGSRRDDNLMNALRAELPGILAWAVRGCLEWQKRKLDPPEIVLAASQEYREDNDTFGIFVEERCVRGAEHNALSSDLFAAYLSWATAAGESAKLTRSTFNDHLVRLDDVTKERFGKNRDRGYVGIGLKSVAPQPMY
jgi:putative DNA primase/helicase